MSYAFAMDRETFLYRLKIPLIGKDYGDTAAEVLQTCALVAEFAQEHTPDQVKSFQVEVKINPQVWSRLIALHKDKRLKAHIDRLPRSYTALYAISRMQDKEIDTAVEQSIIHPEASSHSILKWTKQNRLTAGEAVPPWRCMVVFERDIDEDQFSDMQLAINKVANEYGAKLIAESDYVPAELATDKGKQDLVSRLEFETVTLASPVFARMTERDKSRAGVEQPKDLLTVDMITFGSIMRTDAKFFASGRNSYTPIYVYRLALEYLKTDSRSQRFNYKRRLKQLSETQPDLRDCIDSVLTTYVLAR
jgi:hypothetical protein